MFIREEAVIPMAGGIILHPACIIGAGINRIRDPFNLVKDHVLQGLRMEEAKGHILKIVEPILA